jgi:hypothetical protein
MALNQSVLWFNELAEIYHFLLVQGPQEWGVGGRHNCPQWKTIYLIVFHPLLYTFSDFDNSLRRLFFAFLPV